MFLGFVTKKKKIGGERGGGQTGFTFLFSSGHVCYSVLQFAEEKLLKNLLTDIEHLHSLILLNNYETIMQLVSDLGTSFSCDE